MHYQDNTRERPPRVIGVIKSPQREIFQQKRGLYGYRDSTLIWVSSHMFLISYMTGFSIARTLIVLMTHSFCEKAQCGDFHIMQS